MMRLILIVAAVMSGFVFISLVFFRATRKTYPGFGHWTAGGGFLTLGYLALALRGFIPDALSVFVGNVAFCLGMVLALDGLRRFMGLGPMSRLWYAVPGMDMVAVAVLYFLYDSAFWRTAVMAIATSAPQWPMAALVFSHPVKHKSMFYPVIGCFLGLSGLVVLVRPIGAFFGPQWHLLLDSPFLLGSVIALIVLQLGESLCWMMLNSERVESELAESEADQRLTVDRLQLALAEQKKAEEGLRHSEQKLSMALEGANLAIWEWDLTTGKAVWSERIHKALGYEPDEFEPTLKNWKKIIHPDDWPVVSENLNLHIQGKLPVFEVEYRALNKSGDWHWVYAQGKVIEVDTNGNPMRMAGVVADATDRKKAEEALRESKERYRTIVDLSPMGIFVVVDKCFTYVNQSFADILGFTNASEIIGKPALNFLHPDYNELVEDHIATMLKTGLSVSRTEEKLVRTDGTLVNVEVAAAAIDYDGRRGILVIVSDITKRKQAEEQIKQAEEFLNTVVDNLPIAVFAKSAQNGQFILWNKASEALFGLSREQAIGKTDYDFFPKEQARFFWAKDRESLASGQVIDIPEEPILTKNLGARILHT
ncbi:MAG TPA: PAS domain S-box protein, partial [Desulfomonilaceae bacterium]|nr:PAS domain S-box protein [Desulfomonilaceae bacterium]